MRSQPFAPPPGDDPPAPGYSDTVVHLAAEYWPYARTGGLAEAVRGIARYQAAAGASTVVFMPLYALVQGLFPEVEPCCDPYEVTVADRVERARIFHNPSAPADPTVYFVENPGYFGRDGLYGEEGGAYWDNHLRFAFFCRAVLDWLPRVSPGPTILHAHDWHAALAPVYLRSVLQGDPYYDAVATVLTAHNAGYQGHYGPEVLAHLGLPRRLFDPDHMEWYGHVNLLKGGLVSCDMATTVSPTHAHELRTRTGGFGLHDTFNSLHDRFVGILNGIDYDVWNPETDVWIEANFGVGDLRGKADCKAWLQDAVGLSVRPDVPLFGMTARLVEQKGFDILLRTGLGSDMNAQYVFLGEGEARYRDALRALAESYPDRVGAYFQFTEEREHRLLAASDFLLMPSLYEPCGLTQMRAQRYGALPVARHVGGLADTVEDRVTGFLFDEYQPWALEEAIRYAMELYRDRSVWEEHVREAMTRDFSWQASVARYRDVYQRAVERRRNGCP